MEIIFHQKTIFDTTLLQNRPHIKIAVRYDPKQKKRAVFHYNIHPILI